MSHRETFIVLFVALAILCPSLPAVAEPQFPTRIVDSEGGLRLRTSPDLKGQIIRVIPDGREVDLLEEKPELLVISGKTGKWSRVDTKDGLGEGWVFGGFLADSRVLLGKLAASYNADEEVEPGDSPTWLCITESIVYSGHGGEMEANWYCLVAKVSKKGSVLSVEGNTDRKPAKAEVEWLASGALAKESMDIVLVGPNKIKLGNTIFVRRK
jgi:Bacterial SH3 domain